ncbi:peptidoglycan-binding domain-containing protein [Nannocystaceae bacterium ST9]
MARIALDWIGPDRAWLMRARESELWLGEQGSLRNADIREVLSRLSQSCLEPLRRELRLPDTANRSEVGHALRWALQTGSHVVLVERRASSLQAGIRLPDRRVPPPAMKPPDPPPPLSSLARRYLRVELGALRYRGNSPVHFPLEAPPCPWAAFVTACAHLDRHPSRAVYVVAHSGTGEARLGRPRLDLLRAFLDDHDEAWVELMAEHGSLRDSQVFLRYLADRRRWPTHPGEVNGIPNPQTAKAVESFQRLYNDLFHDDIEVDGVVGRQTLAALFRVAREDLLTWLRVNGVGIGPLHRLPDSAFIEHPSGTPSRWGVWGSMLDIIIVPTDQPAPSLPGDASGIYAEDVTLVDLPLSAVADPMLGLLIIELVDLDGRPVASSDYELRAGADHRVGRTNARGEILEHDVPDERVVVRLADGRAVIFHDALTEAS